MFGKYGCVLFCKSGIEFLIWVMVEFDDELVLIMLVEKIVDVVCNVVS